MKPCPGFTRTKTGAITILTTSLTLVDGHNTCKLSCYCAGAAILTLVRVSEP